jgi:hypothetical protein
MYFPIFTISRLEKRRVGRGTGALANTFGISHNIPGGGTRQSFRSTAIGFERGSKQS